MSRPRASSGERWARRCRFSRCWARSLSSSSLRAEGLLLFGHGALQRFEVALLASDQVKLLVQEVGALFKPALLVARLAAGNFRLTIELFAAAERLLLRMDLRLFADVFGSRGSVRC